jgi:hypothetical protein
MTDSLAENLKMRLNDLRTHATNTRIFENTFSVQVSVAPEELQLELIELDQDSISRSSFNQELLITFLTTASRTALWPTQPPIQWVSGAISLGIKRPGREADHLPPSSAEVNNTWSYTSTNPIRLHGVVLS